MIESGGIDIAVCFNTIIDRGDKDESKANAFLIAAAPELLEGLRDMLIEHGTNGHGMARNEYGEGELKKLRACLKCARALAAIAKAEGRKYE